MSEISRYISPSPRPSRYSWWYTAPSRINSTRPAWLAAEVEWVTISTVCPARLIVPNRSIRLSAARESKAPVGSSARMISG